MKEEQNDPLYEFDGFRLEVSDRRLWKNDQLVPLTGKALDTLVVLIESCGRLVPKDTLLEKVWADTFVEEATLAQNISTLRKAFAAFESDVQFIETVPKRGYRFLRDVSRIDVNDDDEIFLLAERKLTRVVSEQTEFSSEMATASVTRTKTRNLRLVWALSFVAVLAGVSGVYWYLTSFANSANQFSRLETKTLNTVTNLKKIAMSDDGRYMAHVEVKDGAECLSIRQAGSLTSRELIAPSENRYSSLVFSPDGEFVYYTITRPSLNQHQQVGELYKIPILGGPISEVAYDVDSNAALAPDERRVAFIRHRPRDGVSTLIVKEQDTLSETVLAERSIAEPFSDSIAWSASGQLIAATVRNRNTSEKSTAVATFNAATGELKAVSSESWKWIGSLAWLNSDTSIIFVAYDIKSPNMTDDLLLLDVESGLSQRLRGDLNGIFGIGVSKESRAISAVRSRRVSNLLLIPTHQGDEAKVIGKNFGDSSVSDLGLAWAITGKIVYSTAVDGNADIWTVESDGSDQRQLTDGRSSEHSPAVAPDGNSLVYVSNRSGSHTLWMMNIDGTGTRQLVDARDASSPSYSADGNQIYFAAPSATSRFPFLWRVSTNGLELTQLTRHPFLFPQVSPDGEFILGYSPAMKDGKATGGFQPTIIRSDTAEPVTRFDTIKIMDRPLYWMPDGKSFSFVSELNGISNIWIQKLDQSPPTKVTSYTDDIIFRHRWSPNGKTIAVEKGLEYYDILILSDSTN